WRVTAWGVGERVGKVLGRTGPRAADGGPDTAAETGQGVLAPAGARTGESSPSQEHGGGRRDATPQDTWSAPYPALSRVQAHREHDDWRSDPASRPAPALPAAHRAAAGRRRMARAGDLAADPARRGDERPRGAAGAGRRSGARLRGHQAGRPPGLQEPRRDAATAAGRIRRRAPAEQRGQRADDAGRPAADPARPDLGRAGPAAPRAPGPAGRQP